jgi:hypothetical protein
MPTISRAEIAYRVRNRLCVNRCIYYDCGCTRIGGECRNLKQTIDSEWMHDGVVHNHSKK